MWNVCNKESSETCFCLFSPGWQPEVLRFLIGRFSFAASTIFVNYIVIELCVNWSLILFFVSIFHNFSSNLQQNRLSPLAADTQHRVSNVHVKQAFFCSILLSKTLKLVQTCWMRLIVGCVNEMEKLMVSQNGWYKRISIKFFQHKILTFYYLFDFQNGFNSSRSGVKKNSANDMTVEYATTIVTKSFFLLINLRWIETFRWKIASLVHFGLVALVVDCISCFYIRSIFELAVMRINLIYCQPQLQYI